jgi:glycosyltransferase involved in cell wall biosynthesis
VRVAGYFEGVMGTGENARRLVAALDTQGVALATTTLRPDRAPEDDALTRAPRTADGAPSAGSGRFADFNILCANADMVPRVAGELGEDFFEGHYTIGYWWWEVSTFPQQFVPAFGHVEEVWVGSNHVRDAVAPLATVPVVRIPQPVGLAPEAARSAASPGLPEGFRFLFVFDYLSVFERKNPLAAITAFGRAFPPDSGASLIVKSLNDDFNPQAHERLRAAVAGHPDVHLIDRRLARSELDGLMNAADCYVSLHRAEGFGYTLAESMWLGKPVIGTGYSGNVDFMTAENSYVVRHRLVPIGPGNEPYPVEGQWAEPDVDHAAALMREVFEHPDEAKRRGVRGAEEIRVSHSPEAAGRAMVERLELLAASGRRRAARRTAAAAPSATWVNELVSAGPVPPGHPRFGAPQRLARKALLRMLKPVTVHQQRVDGELLRRIEQLEAEVQALRDGEPGDGAEPPR